MELKKEIEDNQKLYNTIEQESQDIEFTADNTKDKNTFRRATFPVIKEHPFFNDISWDEISRRSLPAPFGSNQINEGLKFPSAKNVERPFKLKPFEGDQSAFRDYKYDVPIPKDVHQKELKRLADMHAGETNDIRDQIEAERKQMEDKFRKFLEEKELERVQMEEKFKKLLEDKEKAQEEERAKLKYYQQLALDQIMNLRTDTPQAEIMNLDKNNNGEPMLMDETTTREVLPQHQHQFQCDQCPSITRSSKALRRHKATVHEKVKLFTCGNCGRTFPHKHNWKYHIDNKVCGTKNY